MFSGTLRMSHSSQKSSPTPAAAPASTKRRRGHVLDEATLLSSTTLALWISCLVVSAVGYAIPYARPKPKALTPPPVEAQVLTVELTNDPIPPLDAAPPSDPSQPPPILEIPPQPSSAPQLAAVAEPTPAIAFAMPVEGPVRIVEARQATYVRPAVSETPPPAQATPPVQTITYGRGEGKQAAPTYPYRAKQEGQEGTVVVRFSVDENGRVMAAESSKPSPWPLLNSEAVRVIRQSWRFRPGSMRVFEVSIRFELTR